MRQVAFLVLLILGVLTLVGATFLARRNWRPDIAPYGRRTRPLDLMLHPERYAKAESIRTIRVISLVGMVCLLGALVVVGYDILTTTLR
jgi:Na+/H+ antiporter NhaC